LPALFCLTASLSLAGPRDVVVFKGIGRDLSRYDLRVHRCNEEQIPAGFEERVAQARMLYVGQYSAAAAGKTIFGNAARAAAVKRLLAAGGVVLFDYNGGCDGNIRNFFEKLGLKHPGNPRGEYYECVVAPGSRSPLATTPHGLGGKVGRGYAWWENWPEGFDAPLRHAGDPARAAMLVATGVAGKGTIILTRVFSIFRDEKGTDDNSKRLAENIITYAFGQLPGPGKTVAVYDPFEPRSPAANVLYLKTSGAVRWHAEGAEARVPFLVAEPIGLRRHAAPIEARFELPPGAAPGSVRIRTAWGEPVASQTAADTDAEAAVRCVLELDLAPYQTRLLFAYCGGVPAAPAAEPSPGFAFRDRPAGYVLRNDKIHTELHRDRPSIGLIRPTASNTHNELATWAGMAYGRGAWFASAEQTPKVELVEDGPVRKRLRYSLPDLEVTYTLYAGTGALFYSMRSDTRGGLRLATGWAPGGDVREDALYYEASNGLKELKLLECHFYRPFGRIDQFMKEGWLAIRDARGEVVGQFTDREALGKVTVYRHMTHGNNLTVSSKLRDGPAKGAYLAGLGDWATVRNAYVAWKHPPQVVVGALQKKQDAPRPSIPQFGEQFLAIEGGLGRLPECPLPDNVLRVERVLTQIEKLGGNVVLASAHKPEILAEVLPRAHRRGLGVWASPGLPRKRPCPVAERQAYAQAARQLAESDIDGMYILDEYQFAGTCDGCREAFRKKYGMETPAKFDFGRLGEPAFHNFIFHKMDAITELVRAMTAAGREKRPDILYFMVTSPNNHFRPEGYHDLEKQSAWLTTTCSDLYSTNFDYVKYMMKHMRGAQGNEKPVLSVNGCLYTPRDTFVNAKMHLLAGANAMWHFSLNFMISYPRVKGANAKVLRWLQHTGLGRILARSRPARYLAVLRDRDAFIDSLTRGESTGNLTAYERRVRDLCQMRNVPTDILFTGRLTRDRLAAYKVLVVPSERVLSDDRARLIADYVRAGGRAVIEGETLRHPIMAALCDVKPAGDELASASNVTGAAAPLEAVSAEVATGLVPLAPGPSAATIATADGRPAVTLAGAGKGVAAAVALIHLPVDIAKRLVLHLGGPRPVELPESLEEQIETNLLTDGERTVLAAYNPHYAERRSGEIDASALALDELVVTDFELGVQQKCSGAVSIDLPPDGFGFHLLAAPDGFVLPTHAVSTPGASSTQSSRPGMEFLRIAPEEEPAAGEREKAPGKIYVGIFKTNVSPLSGVDMGAAAMLEALKQQRQLGLVAEHIDDVAPKTLAFYDVVVIPNMKRRPTNMHEQWQRDLHAYVSKGGGALLVHHSTGYASTTPPVFPDLAACPDYVPIQTMKVTADHAVTSGACLRRRFKDQADNPAFGAYLRATQLDAGQEFQCGFADYIKLVPGRAGQTVVKSVARDGQGGDAVVVVGTVGKGRVVLSGMDIGCRSTKVDGKYHFEERVAKGELAILINSIFWLAEAGP